MILAACKERRVEELLDPMCKNIEAWEVLIDSLMGAILWDEDWRHAEIHLDAAPEQELAVKKMLGIDKDYYVDIPPDPSDQEIEGILAILHELTRVE